MRKNEGITLIMLIITIVIMLILLGVSTKIIIDNEMFSKTENAVGQTNNRIKKDDDETNYLLGELNNTRQNQCNHNWVDDKVITEATCTTAGSKSQKCSKCPATRTVEIPTIEHTYVNGACTVCGAIAAGTKAATNAEYIDSAGNKAIIPAGFTVSGKNSEKTISEGLVIYRINDKTTAEIATINWEDETTVETLKQTYDQFVWIPVTNVNSMFMCQSKTADDDGCTIELVDEKPTCTTHNSTQMAGRLYATSYGDNNFDSSLTTQTYTADSGLREPAIVSSDSSNNIELTNLQEEYNSAVTKVIESKGFWIGRYETSGMDSSNDDVEVNIVAGKGTSDGICSINWFRQYKQQQNYASKKLDTTKIQSTMIFGAAWDQTMLFANCATETITTKDLSTVITGNISTDCYNNIYDLCGNLGEWTTEAYASTPRVYRGGSYDSSRSAGNRGTRPPFYIPSEAESLGSRLSLYVSL